MKQEFDPSVIFTHNRIIMASLLHLPEFNTANMDPNSTPPPGGLQPGHQPTLPPQKHAEKRDDQPTSTAPHPSIRH